MKHKPLKENYNHYNNYKKSGCCDVENNQMFKSNTIESVYIYKKNMTTSL